MDRRSRSPHGRGHDDRDDTNQVIEKVMKEKQQKLPPETRKQIS